VALGSLRLSKRAASNCVNACILLILVIMCLLPL
jgi:hypothetical protein